MTRPLSPDPTPPWWKPALGVVFVLAVLLRVPSIGFGLDLSDATQTVHNIQLDERAMVKQEVELMGGDWHPGNFMTRGTAPFYMAGAVNAAVVRARSMALDQDWDTTVAGLKTNPSLIFYVHRSLVALAGVWTVLVVMRLCRREVNARCGLVAGLLLCVSSLHVHLSNVGLVDVPWVLFGMLGFERTLRALRESPGRHLAWAGFWVGLAGATKYPGALVGTMLIGAFIALRWGAARGRLEAPSWRVLGVAVGVSIATFLVCAPRLFFWPQDYVDAIQYQVDVLGVTQSESAHGRVLWEHIETTLGIGLGGVAWIAIAVGFLTALRRGGGARRVALLALCFVPTALVAKTAAPRFGTGMLVALVPVAAIGMDVFLSRVSRVPQIILVALLIAPALVRSVTYAFVMQGPDTRLEMLGELEKRGLSKPDVLGIGHRGLPYSRSKWVRFVSLTSSLRQGKRSVQDVLANPPAYILRDLGSGEPEAMVWHPFRDLVQAEYDEVFRVDGRDEPTEGPPLPGYYLLPRTYVPFEKPWTTSRPGPGLVLYRRRTSN